MADIRAKAAAQSEYRYNEHLVAITTSLTHFHRKITGRTARETKMQIDLRIGKRRGYLPTKIAGYQESPAERAEGGSYALLLTVNGARPNSTIHERKAERKVWRARPRIGHSFPLYFPTSFFSFALPYVLRIGVSKTDSRG